eukprot:3134976-Prymnesium_polylepis.1
MALYQSSLMPLLQQWAALPMYARAGSIPNEFEADSLIQRALVDASGDRPVYDKVTGEVLMVTNDNMQGSRDSEGLPKKTPVIFVTIARRNGEKLVIPVDTDLRALRMDTSGLGWNFHLTAEEVRESVKRSCDC